LGNGCRTVVAFDEELARVVLLLLESAVISVVVVLLEEDGRKVDDTDDAGDGKRARQHVKQRCLAICFRYNLVIILASMFLRNESNNITCKEIEPIQTDESVNFRRISFSPPSRDDSTLDVQNNLFPAFLRKNNISNG